MPTTNDEKPGASGQENELSNDRKREKIKYGVWVDGPPDFLVWEGKEGS